MDLLFCGAVRPIGVMKMDRVNVVGDVGAMLNMQSTFEVANADYFASFTQARDHVMQRIASERL
jgi:hypothetical protein